MIGTLVTSKALPNRRCLIMSFGHVQESQWWKEG